MTAAAEPTAEPAPIRQVFAPRTILALVLVGIVAFAGLTVLAAYAPELRGGEDGGAHALSKSAVGYAGLPILLKAMGTPVTVSRLRPTKPSEAVVVLTPNPGMAAKALQAYPKGPITLIVLPKWMAFPDPLRPGFVQKADLAPDFGVGDLLASYAPKTAIGHRVGRTRPVLHGIGGPFGADVVLPLGDIDRLKTLSGDGWVPALVDEQGKAVLAYSAKTPGIWVLADPDLLNNQGLASFANARAATTILEAARGGDRTILFDVTLNGFEKGRGLLRLMMGPPWLAATLIAVAATVLMGFHALARFGQPHRGGRAIALGARALVDNSADLMRMARKEHELAPAYAALTRALVLRAGGGHLQEHWLDDLAARRGVARPAEFDAEAETTKTRDDLLVVAKKLYDWRGEMTRERR